MEASAPTKKKRRFNSPVSPGKMGTICKGVVPSNTKKATSWAVRVFDEWRLERNATATGEQCPLELLEKPDAHSLNYWLSRFVVEMRRADGDPYPPTTISNVLAGIYRYCKSFVPDCPNFMDRKNHRFRDLTGALQVRYRQLRKEGVGTVVKHAAVVTAEEEDALWKSDVIGEGSPLALQRAIFFYVGKCFCLRGGEEQRNLRLSQFVRSSQPDCFTYAENGSKNNSGTNPKQANKVVPVYAVNESRPRCLVYLLDKYFKMLPPKAFELDIFYLRSKKKFAADGPWYDCVPVGKEKLRTYMDAMCKEAGIKEKKSNHSLRATGATALFNAGVPEKLIRDVTGHRSKALELYERPSLKQQQSVSRILMQGKENANPQQLPANPEQPSCMSSSVSHNVVSPSVFGSLFSGLNNCNVTVSPQNLIVNVGTSVTSNPKSNFGSSVSSDPVSNLLDGMCCTVYIVWFRYQNVYSAARSSLHNIV